MWGFRNTNKEYEDACENNKTETKEQYREGIPVNTEIAHTYPSMCFYTKFKMGKKATKDFINIIQRTTQNCFNTLRH